MLTSFNLSQLLTMMAVMMCWTLAWTCMVCWRISRRACPWPSVPLLQHQPSKMGRPLVSLWHGLPPTQPVCRVFPPTGDHVSQKSPSHLPRFCLHGANHCIPTSLCPAVDSIWIYQTQPVTACAMSSITILQTYQAVCLWVTGSPTIACS